MDITQYITFKFSKGAKNRGEELTPYNSSPFTFWEKGKKWQKTWLPQSLVNIFSTGEYARSRVRRWQLHRERLGMSQAKNVKVNPLINICLFLARPFFFFGKMVTKVKASPIIKGTLSYIINIFKKLILIIHLENTKEMNVCESDKDLSWFT